MNKEQQYHDRIIAWAAIGFLVTLVIGLSVNANAQSSQQSGTACVNGSQYCENNSLDTVNTTTIPIRTPIPIKILIRTPIQILIPTYRLTRIIRLILIPIQMFRLTPIRM